MVRCFFIAKNVPMKSGMQVSCIWFTPIKQMSSGRNVSFDRYTLFINKKKTLSGMQVSDI
jgi:hypothetical protein